MPYLLDLLYLLVLALLSPWLLYKMRTTGKYQLGLKSKFLGRTPERQGDRPCVWFHGVSVGEIRMLRRVVMSFRRRFPEYQVVVSTTTDTGLTEAARHFGDLTVFYWPLDFSWAVKRALREMRPQLVVLAESEIWPNFLWAARKAGIPVAVINGRLSPRTSRRYQRLKLLIRPVVRKVSLWAMQTDEYAAAIRALGAKDEVVVTGNVKYDGVQTYQRNQDTLRLRHLFGLNSSDLVWVAGSTQAPEEEIALDIFRKARERFPSLRLILVARQRERFAEVADLLQRSQVRFVRRSELTGPPDDRAAVILVDTIGELESVWGLADVAFVGGSLDGKRGGQNMIEPAAYGAAVLFGPHVWNFKDTVTRLLQCQAAVQVADVAELEQQVLRLLADPRVRNEYGGRAREMVLTQQGATEKTVQILGHLLECKPSVRSAAA
jgi:3-deoxy-D-manno-octulosonic-acid transferase